ncbi:hypothetical protein ACFCX0_03795 [Streptomyces sp. NPDC056352]|uniref:hypothetical protein n=1 Tax=Streptomyces sp. NPDC056352 TaxID=3345791 RepID=UPI0035E02F92
MSLHLGIRRNSRPKHRAVDAVDALRDENRRLLSQLVGAHNHIARMERDGAKRAEAEEKVVRLAADLEDMTGQRNELVDENEALLRQLAPYLAADANRNAVTVPPSVRDTAAGEDQATAPIDVRPLWAAIGLSPIVRVDNPQATDPTHVPVPAP